MISCFSKAGNRSETTGIGDCGFTFLGAISGVFLGLSGASTGSKLTRLKLVVESLLF